MRLGLILVAAACLLVLFTGLGRVGAIDQREARDLRVVSELIYSREALTPEYGFERLLEKPIVAYLPDVVADLVARHPEEPSRLWRALAGVMLVVLTGSIGAQYFGGRAGLAAALVLATTIALPIAARTDGTQMIGTLLAWLGLAGLADALFGRPAGLEARLLVTYGALAAALMAAGPLPALWPLAGAGIYLALARRWDLAPRLRLIPGLAMMIGLAVPWYGAMLERHGAAFLAHAPFFPYAVEPRGGWLTGPFLAVSFLIVGFFPWSALLPGALLHAATWWRRPRRTAEGELVPGGEFAPMAREIKEETASHFFIACALAALVPILFYPSPPLPAVLPVLPALALLCGRFLDHALEDPARVAAPLMRGVVMLALTGTVAAVLLAMLAGRLRDAAPALRLVGTLVFVTSWLPFLFGLVHRRRAAALLIALPVAIGAPVTHLRLVPALADYLSTRSVAEAANRYLPEHAPIVMIEEPPASFRLYAERNLARADSWDGALHDLRAADGMVYLAFRPARESEVARGIGRPLEVMRRTPSLVLARVRP